MCAAEATRGIGASPAGDRRASTRSHLGIHRLERPHTAPAGGICEAMIEVTLLGTGSPIPDARRAGPSTLVRAGGQTFLVDCGRGVLQRAAAIGVAPNALAALLLTHLHSDHIADLGDVIITRWVGTFAPEPTPLTDHRAARNRRRRRRHAQGVRSRHRLPDRPPCRHHRPAAGRGARVHRGRGLGPRRRADPGRAHRPPAGRRRRSGSGSSTHGASVVARRRHRARAPPSTSWPRARTPWCTPRSARI